MKAQIQANLIVQTQINRQDSEKRLDNESKQLNQYYSNLKSSIDGFKYSTIDPWKIGDNENPILEGKDEIINFSFEVEDNIIDVIDKKLCLEIAKAMGDFKKYIMIPAIKSNLKENILIIKQ